MQYVVNTNKVNYLQYFVGVGHNYGISGQQSPKHNLVITIAVYCPKLNSTVL